MKVSGFALLSFLATGKIVPGSAQSYSYDLNSPLGPAWTNNWADLDSTCGGPYNSPIYVFTECADGFCTEVSDAAGTNWYSFDVSS